jgi:hypothetical protein
MNFIKELETHLESFESKAKEDIQKFIDFVKTKYSEPAPAVVAPPAPIAPNGELTIGQVSVEEATPEVVEEATPETTIQSAE